MTFRRSEVRSKGFRDDHHSRRAIRNTPQRPRRGLPLPRLRPILGVEFRLDFRVRNRKESPHKIREMAKVACWILRGTLWVTRHSDPLEMRVQEWCVSVNFRDWWQLCCLSTAMKVWMKRSSACVLSQP